MNFAKDLESEIAKQSTIQQNDPILLWTNKTLLMAREKDLFPIDVSMCGSTFIMSKGSMEEFHSVTLTFAAPSGKTIEYEIRRSSNEDTIYLWCGPSHLPISDQAVAMYLDRISAFMMITHEDNQLSHNQ